MTKTSVGKLTYQFKDMPMIKNQVLYREGEKADFVYIVKSGQFEVSKLLPSKPAHLGIGGYDATQESTKKIFENPLKAHRVVNTQMLNNSLKS